jgi:putative ATP-dependent endonuclease of the OLD family
MLIKKIIIENVRSFLDRREMLFDGLISIVIGPNGGGKTNLLDTVTTMLKRHLYAAQYLVQSTDADGQIQWQLRQNEQLQSMLLEKHSLGRSLPQYIAIEIEVSKNDLENMRRLQVEAEEIRTKSKKRFQQNPWEYAAYWQIDDIKVGQRLIYELLNGIFQQPSDLKAVHFHQYLQIFELDNAVRAEIGKDALQFSMLYLPVNRAVNGFPATFGLANYNDYEQKRSSDAISSRNAGNIISLAIGRLAAKYRLLQENDNTNAKQKFRADSNLKELSDGLKDLGYNWELLCTDPLSNTYDIILEKQGTYFKVSDASSGEKELLTYLFVIYSLNIRDTVIIVDEPELHLHPRWQTTLFALFEKLALNTGNQFLLATHSPTFISPASIQYVSRVYIEDQKSNIIRLNSINLPNNKHLFNIVNSQNNEKIFFTEKVILVEGISDKIFFEKVLDIVADRAGKPRDSAIEIISVGGKGLFAAYMQLLEACRVKFAIIADLDYIEQIGSSEIKELLCLNSSEIKDDVINNPKSFDADTLVARIDEAIETGNWKDASDIWKYIKSRRRRLPAALSENEQILLDKFLKNSWKNEVFILRKGALEEYLPDGCRSKNLEKLIEFVESDDFWQVIPAGGQDEIELIAKTLLQIP